MKKFNFNSKERQWKTNVEWTGKNRYAENLRYDLECGLSDTIKFLSDLEKRLKSEGWMDLRLEFSNDDYCDSYGATIAVKLIGSRKETDKEFEARQKELLRLKELKKEVQKKNKDSEYNTYLRLKEKFEKV